MIFEGEQLKAILAYQKELVQVRDTFGRVEVEYRHPKDALTVLRQSARYFGVGNKRRIRFIRPETPDDRVIAFGSKPDIAVSTRVQRHTSPNTPRPFRGDDPVRYDEFWRGGKSNLIGQRAGTATALIGGLPDARNGVQAKPLEIKSERRPLPEATAERKRREAEEFTLAIERWLDFNERLEEKERGTKNNLYGTNTGYS